MKVPLHFAKGFGVGRREGRCARGKHCGIFDSLVRLDGRFIGRNPLQLVVFRDLPYAGQCGHLSGEVGIVGLRDDDPNFVVLRYDARTKTSGKRRTARSLSMSENHVSFRGTLRRACAGCEKAERSDGEEFSRH